MTIKDSELKAILAEVETELGALLKSEQEKLVKAMPGEDSPLVPPSPAPSPAAEPSPPSPKPESPAAEAAPSPEAAPMDEGAVDPAALEAEYAKLSPEELKMHYLAVKSALFKLLGGGEGAEKAERSPVDASYAASPAGEASRGPASGEHSPRMGKAEYSPSPSPSPEAKKMELSAVALTKLPEKAGPGSLAELAPTPLKGRSEKKVQKSEETMSNSELDELRNKVQEYESKLDLLTKAVDCLAGQPMRKAVTGVSFVPKTESEAPVPTRAEIDSHLKNITATPNLQKSDRKLINEFYDGRVNFDKIAHLFKDYKGVEAN